MRSEILALSLGPGPLQGCRRGWENWKLAELPPRHPSEVGREKSLESAELWLPQCDPGQCPWVRLKSLFLVSGGDVEEMHGTL